MEDAGSLKRITRYGKPLLLFTITALIGSIMSPIRSSYAENPVSISITSPANGNVIADSSPQLGYRIAGGSNNLIFATVDRKAVNKRSGESFDALSEGQHTVAMEVTDESGNKASAQSTFVVDTKAPAVRIISPANGSAIKGSKTINVATDGTGSQIRSTEIRIDGATVNKRPGDSISLPGGNHTMVVEVVDEAGNRASAQSTFTVDTEDPNVTILSPVDSSTTSKTPLLRYGIEGTGSTIKKVLVLLDGNVISKKSGSKLGPLTSGSHSVTVIALDSAVNSYAVQSNFTVGASTIARSSIKSKTAVAGVKIKPVQSKKTSTKSIKTKTSSKKSVKSKKTSKRKK